MVLEFVLAVNRHQASSLPIFVCFTLVNHLKGRIKNALLGPSFPGLYTAFKEREGQGQLVAEHVDSGEMLKAKRKARGLQRKSSVSGDFWVGRGQRDAGEKKWEKSKEQKLRKVKRGWPAERAKEIDRHSGGM